MFPMRISCLRRSSRWPLFSRASPPAGALLPILGMDDPFHYRNKVISPYAPAKGAKRKGKDAKLTRADILTGM